MSLTKQQIFDLAVGGVLEYGFSHINFTPVHIGPNNSRSPLGHIIGDDLEKQGILLSNNERGVGTLCSSHVWLRELVGDEKNLAFLTGMNLHHDLQIFWMRESMDLMGDCDAEIISRMAMLKWDGWMRLFASRHELVFPL